MSSDSHSQPRLGRPGRAFWTTLGVVLSLLGLWLVVIEGAILIATIVLPFVVLVGLGVWGGSRLVGRSNVPFRSGPLTAAGVLSVLVLVYSFVIEGAVLLGLVACVLILGVGTALGLVLAQDRQQPAPTEQSRVDVESQFRGRTEDRNDEREHDRER
ncbi:hypothetical protein [Halomarina oriensis]|uniref:Uncharacterized protein n=1 Tax=Halomarina oriensis TaxID=671145 RepID=A0A6B0GYK7_9EURY|nr:hypothetical protein [Halomarina oriensis]MWG36828.1 hypothetical protein [Halomarina oriensis]